MAFLKDAGNFIGEVAEGASEFPNFLRKKADQVSDFQREKGQELKSNIDTGDAGQNIKESQFAGIGAKVGAWFSKPGNMILAGLAVAATVFVILSASGKT